MHVQGEAGTSSSSAELSYHLPGRTLSQRGGSPGAPRTAEGAWRRLPPSTHPARPHDLGLGPWGTRGQEPLVHRLESPCVQSELPWRGNRFSTPVTKCCFPGKSFTALETEPRRLLALHSFYQSSVHVAAATAPNGKHRQTDGRTHTPTLQRRPMPRAGFPGSPARLGGSRGFVYY